MFNTGSKPLVIVTGPDKAFKFGWWATRFMLRVAGLRGHYLTPAKLELPNGARGIIIGGGDDIEPEHYGLMGDAGTRYDPGRDALEIRMLKKAFASGIPVLGICRGAQLINVTAGGSLFTDIRPRRKRTTMRNSIFPIRWADIEQGTILRQVLNRSQIKVNSLHNQAIDSLAPGLRIAARDGDGFVQAIEHCDNEKFILGVQWHPEYMPYARSQRQLFHAFASAVRNSEKVLV